MKNIKTICLLMMVIILTACGKSKPSDSHELSKNDENQKKEDSTVIESPNDVANEDASTNEEEKIHFQYDINGYMCDLVYSMGQETGQFSEVDITEYGEIYLSSADDTVIFQRKEEQGTVQWYVYHNEELLIYDLVINAEQESRVYSFKDAALNLETSEITGVFFYKDVMAGECGFCIITVPIDNPQNQSEQYFCTLSEQDSSIVTDENFYPGYALNKAVFANNHVYFTDDMNGNSVCKLDIITGDVTGWDNVDKELSEYAKSYDGIISDIVPLAYEQGYLLVSVSFGEREVSVTRYAVFTENGEFICIIS